MNAKDCEWAKKNELLQKELRNTLRSALQDTEIEEHSLTALEQVTQFNYLLTLSTGPVASYMT